MEKILDNKMSKNKHQEIALITIDSMVKKIFIKTQGFSIPSTEEISIKMEGIFKKANTYKIEKIYTSQYYESFREYAYQNKSYIPNIITKNNKKF